MYQFIKRKENSDEIYIQTMDIASHSIKIRTHPNDLRIFNQLLINDGWVKRKVLIKSMMEDGFSKKETKKAIDEMLSETKIFWVKLNGGIWYKPSAFGDMLLSEEDWKEIEKEEKAIKEFDLKNRDEYLKLKSEGVVK